MSIKQRDDPNSEGSERSCHCELPAVRRTTTKEGPNQGRIFWKCSQDPQCAFFEWDDEPPRTGKGSQTPSMGAGSQSGGQSSDQCFKVPRVFAWILICLVTVLVSVSKLGIGQAVIKCSPLSCNLHH